MGDVIALFDQGDPEQHATGEAFCLACDHTWTAVIPTGITVFDCPKCKSVNGRFRFEFQPPDDVWTCNCGNQLFNMTPEGHFCPRCGIYQKY